jgi:hypothetical protein
MGVNNIGGGEAMAEGIKNKSDYSSKEDAQYNENLNDSNKEANMNKTKEFYNYDCYFEDKYIGSVNAKDEKEAHSKMEQTWPELPYGLYDGVVDIIKVDDLKEDLIQSSSDKAFKKNVNTELKAGKPMKQALAIAYSIKERNEMKESLNSPTYGVDYNIQTLQEVMEGMTDNTTSEDINYTINMFRAIGRQLHKPNFEYIVALTGDEEYDPENHNLHGEIFIKKYPELKFYRVEDLEFVRESINRTIWLYFRDEDAAFAYIDMISKDSLNESIEKEELHYDDLPITIYDGDKEYEKEISWSLFIDKEDIEDFLLDYVPEEVSYEESKDYIKGHYKEMVDANKDAILDHYRDEAREDAGERYQEDDEYDLGLNYGAYREDLNNTKENTLIKEIKEAIRDYYSDFDDEEYKDFIEDYTIVEITPAFDNDMLKVEVRMEIGYDSFIELIDEKLNPIIQKYDKEAYFDMEDAGIANTFLSKKLLKEEDENKKPVVEAKMKDIYTDMQEAGGKEKYTLQLEDELRDTVNYRDYLDNQGRKEVGKGGAFDSMEELNATIEELNKKIDSINNELSIVRR